MRQAAGLSNALTGICSEPMIPMFRDTEQMDRTIRDIGGNVDAEFAVKSVERTAMILKRLATNTGAGWRLSDIARETGLRKTTTHRLLAALISTGFAYQSPGDRRYHLGYEFIRLGAAATRYDIIEIAKPALIRLARRTGDTVFLSIREGLQAVCVDRQVGDFPIKTLTLEIGDRRPLGVGSGSLALLAALPDAEIAEIIKANRAVLAKHPKFAPPHLQTLIAQARANGYSFNGGRIVSAMCAVGVPIRDPRGTVIAALSIAAIAERMGKARIKEIASLLQDEAANLTQGLSRARARAPDQDAA
jgi:DNA-binding IclR family transcriptional regulator